MSGFGGGFGSSQHSNPFGFGQPQQQQIQPVQPPSSFGFTNNSSTQPQTFGSSSGGTSNLFGAPPPAAPINQFGMATTSVFGQPASAGIVGPFGQPPASTGTMNSFGTPGSMSSFGAPSQSGHTTSFNPFGHSGGVVPFSNQSQYPQQQPISSVPNPFAVNNSSAFSSAAPMMSFGVSSNVADDSEMMNSGSNSPIPTSWNNSLFSPGFPQQTEVDMGDDDKPAPLSNLPFGTPVVSNFSKSSVGSNTASWNSGNATSSAPNPFQPIESAFETDSRTLSPVMADASNSAPDETDREHMSHSNTESARLAELKAKIEEKKKKLEEKKRNEAQHKTKPSEGNKNVPDSRSSPFPVGGPSGDAAGSSLAERNALRFGNSNANQDTRSLLPTDLDAETATDYGALRQTQTDAIDLGSAKSLIGKCIHMCPGEELLRRQREGDIQLLELVSPGNLHPEGWTLRDTVVKRFRRSAADYKLDVPEWVRPPHVLERVCAYLEEWVMERDRQGPDVRYQSGTPPSLDVYQFIWDRTRMVRKDFILQNYVGTSGKCDARAVRCHERIARWHAMCEHQLSHIDDFVIMQSQQNIQELGQTMKTLNQYYDDVLHRSTVEEPDDNGKEQMTKTAADKWVHGCQANIVQGRNPVDYDGTPLNNTADNQLSLSRRAIGRPNHHGTAEEEMSGLYILLAIEIDGGMEVMRYVSHLSRARPHIYRSKLVQLALSIFKAKKEYNYTRFFQIIRQPTTPYLFACIMFKHVDLMRKVAFQIMAKTYGAKSKDTNEAFYDAFPLKDLVILLCFEDEEEACTACRHFNIAVETVKVRSSSGTRTEEIVFWRQSSFLEPKDETKGTVVPLRPRKMIRTIEAKLNGATRLAVCRGEVSEGVSFPDSCPVESKIAEVTQGDDSSIHNTLLSNEQETLKVVDAERQSKELEAQKRLEEEIAWRQLEEERIWKEEQIRREGEERERELKRLAEQQRKAEEERLRLQRIEELKEKEAARAKAEAKQRLEKERQEAARRKREEEERRKQLEEIARRKKEEELKAARRKALEEKRRKEAEERERMNRIAEARRIELERQRRERERRELEERREAEEWSRAVNAAREKISFCRWLHKFPTNLRLLDATSAKLESLGRNRIAVENISSHGTVSSHLCRGLRNITESLLRKPSDIQPAAIFHHFAPKSNDLAPCCTLYKVAVVFPDAEEERVLHLFALLQSWIANTLSFGTPDVVKDSFYETRVVFVDGNAPNVAGTCDGILVVVPCLYGKSLKHTLVSLKPLLAANVPRVALLLIEYIEGELETASKLLETELSDSTGEIIIVANDMLDDDSISSSLSTSIEYLAEEIKNPKCIERMSIEKLCMKCVATVLWTGDYDKRDSLVIAGREALAELYQALSSFYLSGNHDWPGAEFAVNSNQVVPNYFGRGFDLPLAWSEVSKSTVKQIWMWIEQMNGQLPAVINRFLLGAPRSKQEECRILMGNHSYRRALEVALRWLDEAPDARSDEDFVYLPVGASDELVQLVSRKVAGKLFAQHFSIETAVFGDTAQLQSASPEKEDATVPKRSRDIKTPLDEVVDVQEDEVTRRSIRDAKRLKLEGRGTPKAPKTSADFSESVAFTKRLQAMVSGELFRDRMVGSKPLSALLQGSPKPDE
ncbi:hypothetical protein ACA910_010740 [Epithemia clementina (nom. ined.)]